MQRPLAVVPKRVNENGSGPVRGHLGEKGALRLARGRGGALGVGDFANAPAQTKVQVKRKPV